MPEQCNGGTGDQMILKSGLKSGGQKKTTGARFAFPRAPAFNFHPHRTTGPFASVRRLR
jgi:hypothetical protein